MDLGDLAELDYGMGMSVKTLVTAMGMQAENNDRISKGESIAYPEKAFQDLLEENGINHNAIISRWDRREKLRERK